VAGDAASRAIAACASVAPERTMDLAYGFMRAVWAEGRDIADPATIAAIVGENGLDAAALTAAAATPGVQARIDANTEEAITAEVFGAPTYVPRFGAACDQRFWGQDRLVQLAFALGG
jgi:2-hydroxychromene-2-carboxylate isomerase